MLRYRLASVAPVRRTSVDPFASLLEVWKSESIDALVLKSSSLPNVSSDIA